MRPLKLEIGFGIPGSRGGLVLCFLYAGPRQGEFFACERGGEFLRAAESLAQGGYGKENEWRWWQGEAELQTVFGGENLQR